MTSHAILANDPPGGYGQAAGAGEDFWMYLQLRATTGTVNKCLSRLDRQLQAHPGADAEIVGLSTDQHAVRVIIGINLGDSLRIKTRPKKVLDAYELVQSLSAELANFWPQYLTGVPTDDERELLASIVAAGAIQTLQTRLTMAAGPDLCVPASVLAFEPERQLVGGGAWHAEADVA